MATHPLQQYLDSASKAEKLVSRAHAAMLEDDSDNSSRAIHESATHNWKFLSGEFGRSIQTSYMRLLNQSPAAWDVRLQVDDLFAFRIRVLRPMSDSNLRLLMYWGDLKFKMFEAAFQFPNVADVRRIVTDLQSCQQCPGCFDDATRVLLEQSEKDLVETLQFLHAVFPSGTSW